MAIQKKHGKGRLDKWYKLAKEKGYRARAAFKLIQLNKKYGFLEKSKVLLDLCAAPGVSPFNHFIQSSSNTYMQSWCQVAAESMPAGSLIVGVDLSPIKPIPRVISFQSDITTDKCRATIRSHFKTWKADTVLHDGAPNVGTAWVQDSFNQAELTLQAMKLATEFLCEGGTFVTKVFRSKDYNSLLWVFNQLFTKVEATKPPSSRNVSAEIFVVCRGFKAPKRIDPKFLDPRSVFAELSDPTPNNEAKVFNPEVKKRKRDGYEEGNYTQFKEVPASEFIQTTDPIAILGSLNRLSFEQPPNGDVALAALDKLPETTQEIRDCCADLRVLGRKEFRNLLRWRLKVREKFGFATKKSAKDAAEEEVAEVEPMDEELKIQEELQALSEKESSRKKRERRRANEQKQKEIIRMQLHMTAPTEIGLEQAGPNGEGSMFGLRTIDKSGAVDKIAKGKMAILTEADLRKDRESAIGGADTDSESDPEEDRLDRDLDAMYEQYQERKSDIDAKFRAKKARKEHEDGDWEGFSADGHGSDDDDDKLEQDSSDDDSDDEPTSKRPLLTDLEGDGKKVGGLSKRAAQFFNQDIFKDIGGLPEEESDEEMEDGEEEIAADLDQLDSMLQRDTAEEDEESDIPEAAEPMSEDSEDEAGFEVVKRTGDDAQWEDEEPRKDGKLGSYSATLFSFPDLTERRHRHHHSRSHDTSPTNRLRRKEPLRPGGRRLQQIRIQRPRRSPRLVPGRRRPTRQAAPPHHRRGRRCHKGETPGPQRSTYQESARSQRSQEVPRSAAIGEIEKEVCHVGG